MDVYGDNLSKLDKDSDDAYVDEAMEEGYAKRLIENVIDSMADTKYKKKRRRLPHNRLD